MIYIYNLDKCIYGVNAIKLLNKNKIPFKEIIVKDEQKEKYKIKNKMQTFPQIFFKHSSGRLIKIGGYDNLVDFFEFCKYSSKF